MVIKDEEEWADENMNLTDEDKAIPKVNDENQGGIIKVPQSSTMFRMGGVMAPPPKT